MTKEKEKLPGTETREQSGTEYTRNKISEEFHRSKSNNCMENEPKSKKPEGASESAPRELYNNKLCFHPCVCVAQVLSLP